MSKTGIRHFLVNAAIGGVVGYAVSCHGYFLTSWQFWAAMAVIIATITNNMFWRDDV